MLGSMDCASMDAASMVSASMVGASTVYVGTLAPPNQCKLAQAHVHMFAYVCSGKFALVKWSKAALLQSKAALH